MSAEAITSAVVQQWAGRLNLVDTRLSGDIEYATGRLQEIAHALAKKCHEDEEASSEEENLFDTRGPFRCGSPLTGQ